MAIYLSEPIPSWRHQRLLAMTAIATVLLLVGGCVANPPTSDQPPTAPPSAGAASAASTVNKTVLAGARSQVGFYTALHADCTSSGYPIVRILTHPEHGSVTTDEASDYPAYPRDNQRYDCNLRKVPGTRVLYQSEPAFSGSDVFVVEVIFPSADARTVSYGLAVRRTQP